MMLYQSNNPWDLDVYTTVSNADISIHNAVTDDTGSYASPGYYSVRNLEIQIILFRGLDFV